MNKNRINQGNFSGGMQTKVVPDLINGNQVLHCINGETDTKTGAITGRLGSLRQSIVVASQPILSLLIYYKNDLTKKYLASSDDGGTNVDLFINADENFSGVWSKTLEDWITAYEINGVNFANKLYCVNGVNAPKYFDGTLWYDLVSAPLDGKYPEVYNQRLYILSTAGILWYSDVVNATGDGFSSSVWTNIGVNPNDGQLATGLIRHRGRLFIFKNESIYRYDGNTEPEASIRIGAHSPKSIISLGSLFFFHSSGIHSIDSGDPVLISRPIQKFIDGMDTTNWSKVSAGKDTENVYFWLGNCTINDVHEFDYGAVYQNVVAKHNIYSQSWTIYTNWDARLWIFDESNGATYFADSTGKIFKIKEGYSDIDDTTILPIYLEVVFTPRDWGFPEKEKKVGRIIALGEFNSELQVGDSFNNLKSSNFIEKGEANFPESIIAKDIWVALRESYTERPPRITNIIYDNVDLFDDAK